MSSLIKSLDSKFNEISRAINEERGRWPSSQGSNALVIVYPPKEEKKYLKRVYETFREEYIIDLSKLFIEYIEQYSIDNFKEMYQNYRSTSVFVDLGESETDLLRMILNEIEKAIGLGKIPVIIRTGILYGTGIRNNHILESNQLNKSKKPLLIFYPGEVEKDLEGKERVYFLGVVKASDYRGQLI